MHRTLHISTGLHIGGAKIILYKLLSGKEARIKTWKELGLSSCAIIIGLIDRYPVMKETSHFIYAAIQLEKSSRIGLRMLQS